MVNIGNFNADEYETRTPGDFPPIPEGWTAMQAVETFEEHDAAVGQKIVMVFEVIEADHPELRGKKLWVRLALNNPNEIYAGYARSDFAAMCKAAGKPRIGDTNELLFIPMALKIKHTPKKNGDGVYENARGYDAYASRFGGGSNGGASAATARTPQPQATGQAAPASNGSVPWGN